MPLVLQIPTELHTWISYLAIPMRIGRKQVEKGGFGKQTNKQTDKKANACFSLLDGLTKGLRV